MARKVVRRPGRAGTGLVAVGLGVGLAHFRIFRVVPQLIQRRALGCFISLRFGQSFGLRIPGVVIAPARGDAHRTRCLEALALFRVPATA